METIKSKQDFEKVFQSGKRLNHRLVRLTVSPVEEGGRSRVGFRLPAKRLGNAVCRNRCKRVLRAAARQAGFPLSGYEVILFSTPATRNASSTEVAEALAKLAKRIQ